MELRVLISSGSGVALSLEKVQLLLIFGFVVLEKTEAGQAQLVAGLTKFRSEL